MSTDRPVGRSGAVSVTVGRNVVACSHERDVLVLPPAWSLLWPLLDGSATCDELARDVADVFELPLEEAATDVARFVEELRRHHLIEDDDPPPPASHRRRDPFRPWDPGMVPTWTHRLTVSAATDPVVIGTDDDDVEATLRDVYRARASAASDDQHGADVGIACWQRPGAGPRLVPRLIAGPSLLLVSRSIPRLLRHLDLIVSGQGTDNELDMSAFVRGDSAVLVPAALAQRSSAVEAQVRAAGAGIAEAAAVSLDLMRGEVVIQAGDHVRHAALQADGLAVTAGRYRLRGAFWAADETSAEHHPATSVARLVDAYVREADDLATLLSAAADLAPQVRSEPIPEFGSDISVVLDALAGNS